MIAVIATIAKSGFHMIPTIAELLTAIATVEEGEMYLCPKQIKTAASCFKGSTKASTNSINTSYSQLLYFTRHLGSKSFTLKVSLLSILFVRLHEGLWP